MIPMYKVLIDGKSCHGGDMDWSLPTLNDDGTYTPGEWMRVDGQLVLCERAIHLTDQPAAWYIEGAQCWLAEYRGCTVGELTGTWESKIGVREARLIAPVPWEDVGVWSDGNHVVRGGVVRASGSASVRAYDNASVWASDNASVRAYGSASVTAYGSASVTSVPWHMASAEVALSQMAAHIDRRGGKLVLRSAEGARA